MVIAVGKADYTLSIIINEGLKTENPTIAISQGNILKGLRQLHLVTGTGNYCKSMVMAAGKADLHTTHNNRHRTGKRKSILRQVTAAAKRRRRRRLRYTW